ncbi:MAG: RecX family transcriptional regulator [Bacilli bacterium]|nr:RecX family transcriptional regulator [Bacilli bacterium]
MKIVKYEKVGKNKYKVYLENGDTLILYEDIILKYELLITKEIDDIELIEKENIKYELYDKVLGFISKRIRCESEIRKYLQKYTSDLKYIDNIIDKLYQNKLLDNELYIKSFIHDKINFTNDGPIKIKKNLEDLKFDSFLIDDMLIEFNSKIQNEKINNYIEKNLKSNTKSLYVFKQKMLINLINLGYYKENIISVLDKINFNDSEERDKEIDKLRNKYSKKYQGRELEYFIKRKLYEKGFRD